MSDKYTLELSERQAFVLSFTFGFAVNLIRSQQAQGIDLKKIGGSGVPDPKEILELDKYILATMNLKDEE